MVAENTHIAPDTEDAAKPARPQALEVLPDGIPDELKVRPQWVCWRYTLHREKWTKHPYCPGAGRKASSTDLLTWSTFEEVMAAYEGGTYDGIGFVFCSGDPFTGIDLDECRDPEAGEVEAWAAEIVCYLNSHTEASPSGRGIHIIVKGKVPTPLKRDSIEMYSLERYFTITGWVVEIRCT